MRSILFAMTISLLIPIVSEAQQWQTVLSVDSRVGYSTNSYLNPFLSEWDSTVESGYNLTSAMVQTYWHKQGHSISMTGGALFEPLFNVGQYWKGAIGSIKYDYRFSSFLSIGLNGGASYIGSSYSRTTAWIQPKVTWRPSLFTLFRLKAGSNFREYTNNTYEGAGNGRFDLYALEFETWPSYRWRITAGLYGALEHIPQIQEGVSARSAVEYHFNNGAQLDFNVGLEQYQTERTEETALDGGPPFQGLPGGDPNTVTIQNTDRIVRLGLTGTLPVSNRFSIYASIEALRLDSEVSGTTTDDYHLSGGVRYSFQPRFRTGGQEVTPQWDINPARQRVNIKFPTEGRLYLVGEFNNWSKAGIPLRKQEGNIYVAELDLTPGSYEYKILQKRGDEEIWLPFSSETYTVNDGFGSENAILLVE